MIEDSDQTLKTIRQNQKLREEIDHLLPTETTYKLNTMVQIGTGETLDTEVHLALIKDNENPQWQVLCNQFQTVDVSMEM